MNSENLSDRRRQTRSRLVEAGVSVFAVKGIAGASIEEICEAGGLTRGAFYSNFSSRDDLVLATIEMRTAETLDRLDGTISRWKERLGETPADPADIRPLLTEFIDEIFSEKQHTVASVIAEYEIELYCLRVPHLRERYEDFDASRLERLSALVRTALENIGATTTIPLDSLLSILISVFTQNEIKSTAGKSLADPADVDTRLIVEVLLKFLDFDTCEVERTD